MSFEYFGRLPVELRLKIWTLCLPGPRIVSIVAATVEEKTQFEYPAQGDAAADFARRNTAYGVSSFPSSPFGGEVIMPPIVSRKIRRCFQEMYATPRLFAPMMHVNVEARGVAMRACVKLPSGRRARHHASGADSTMDVDGEVPQDVFGTTEYMSSAEGSNYFFLNNSVECGPDILFNPNRDVLYLGQSHDFRLENSEDFFSGVEILLRWLNPEIIAKIRCLAMPFTQWQRDRERFLDRIKEFPALERIWVSLLRENLDDVNFPSVKDARKMKLTRSSCLRGVSHNPYLLQAKEELLWDWEHLQPKWGERHAVPKFDAVPDTRMLKKLLTCKELEEEESGGGAQAPDLSFRPES